MSEDGEQLELGGHVIYPAEKHQGSIKRWRCRECNLESETARTSVGQACVSRPDRTAFSRDGVATNSRELTRPSRVIIRCILWLRQAFASESSGIPSRVDEFCLKERLLGW